MTSFLCGPRPGDITLADVMSVQPFRNTVDIVELNGWAILQVMEHSASKWDRMELNGAFLQHSGKCIIIIIIIVIVVVVIVTPLYF